MNRQQILDLLAEVKDPEIPVLNVVDMGVVRDVTIDGEHITVTITPTYSGCPAMDVISANIRSALKRQYGDSIEVKTSLYPPWTTDWLTDDAKEKLRAYGIAPPEKSSPDKGLLFGDRPPVPCPRCGSENTSMVSEFGSTSCKSHYKCNDCLEPFDHFKCI